MNINDCYKTLEIPPDSTYEEAKAAYRLMAQVWHPDKHSHNDKIHAKATAKLKEINAAWNNIEGHFKNSAAREANKECKRKSGLYKIVVCSSCNTRNRVPTKNTSSKVKCGNCKEYLYSEDKSEQDKSTWQQKETTERASSNITDDHNLNAYIEKYHSIAKYGLNSLFNKYHDEQDMFRLLDLIHPSNVVGLIKDIVKVVPEMCINIYHSEYSNYCNKLNNQLQIQLRPSIKMEKMLLDYFMSSHEDTDKALIKFSDRYNNVVDYINNTKSDLQNKSFGGGVVSGILAGLAFGPIGAVVGGIAASCFIEGNIKESAKGDIEIMFNDLFAEFDNTMNQVSYFLEDVMVGRLISATNEYKECLLMQKPLF